MTGILVLALYVGAFFASFFIAKQIFKSAFEKKGFNKLKTVTFGDESAITANRVASVVSVITIFWLWVAFTNSSIPLPKFPGPFLGDAEFTYTVQLEDGSTDDATVTMRV